MKARLSEEQVFELINSLDDELVQFDRVRPHNKGEIRKADSMAKEDFKAMVTESIEEEWLPGGDIEVIIPKANKILVGHHDGIYWLE